MSKLLVTDELWALVEPLLPPWPPRPKGGRPPTPDRVCLTGILFVLKGGLPWELFPQEMGCCGMTLWNRLADWLAAGVWDALHRLLLAELRGADAIDFDRVVVDAAHVRAVHGGKKRARARWTGRNAGRSTTSRSTRTGRRWRRRSRPATSTTSRC